MEYDADAERSGNEQKEASDAEMRRQDADPQKDEDAEIRAAEEVINSMNYYSRYVLVRLKRHGDAIRYSFALLYHCIVHVFSGKCPPFIDP